MKFVMVAGQLVEANPIKDAIKAKIQETINEFLLAVLDTTIHLIGAAALVGGGIAILLGVVGFKEAYRYGAGLVLLNVIVKYLFAGVV